MTLTFHVDWNHDGAYDDPAEDVTPYVLGAEWSLGRADPADVMPAEGRATLVLDNLTRRFSPAHADGPLYGDLVPGRRLRITYDPGDGAVTLWQGWLLDIVLEVGTAGHARAILRAAGGLFRLRATPVEMAPQQDVTAGAIIRQALNRVQTGAGMQPGWLLGLAVRSRLGETTRLLDLADQLDADDGLTIFTYAGDSWPVNATVYDAVAAMVAAEQGVFWQARDGTFVFRDRRHWTRQTALAATVDLDAEATGAEYAFGRDITAVVRVTCYPRSISAPGIVIWRSTNPLRVGGLATRVLRVHFDTAAGLSVGVLAAETPLPHSDYTAVDKDDRDYTSALRVSLELAGETARLTLTNSAPVTLYVTLALRGQTITRVDAVTVEAADTASQVEYGLRLRRLDLPELDDPDLAEELAGWVLGQFNRPAGALDSLTLRDSDDVARARIAAWTFGDRLRITETQTATSADSFIVGEAHAYSPREGLRTTYRLLSVPPFFVLGDSALGDRTVLGY